MKILRVKFLKLDPHLRNRKIYNNEAGNLANRTDNSYRSTDFDSAIIIT